MVQCVQACKEGHYMVWIILNQKKIKLINNGMWCIIFNDKITSSFLVFIIVYIPKGILTRSYTN